MTTHDHLTDANLSIGPMSWCNYCQQNVGGAIKHKAGCKTLTDAELLALKLAHPERYGIDGPIVVTKTINIPDAQRIIQQLRNDNNDAAADLIEALREQCERQRKALEAIKDVCEDELGSVQFCSLCNTILDLMTPSSSPD